MGVLLFLALLAVPAGEILIFIKVGGLIGLWPTLGLIFASALAGAAIIRWQGLATLGQVRAQLARGEVPVDEMLHGLALVVAAFTLLTPGFATDALGALLLIPPLRRLAVKKMKRHLALHVLGPAGARTGPTVIEGEYHDVTPEEEKEPRDLPPHTPAARGSARR